MMRPIFAAKLLVAAASAHGAVTLTAQHVDLSINYNSNGQRWQLTARDENSTTEYAAGEALLRVGLEARVEVPDQPGYEFLGAPGDSSWILPQTQEPDLLYLGLSTENKSAVIAQNNWEGVGVPSDMLVRGVSAGTFLNNQITLSLAAVNGPGFFALYSAGPFGTINVVMNSRDGISSSDMRLLTPNRHEHYNWAFSAPGTYQITLVASGTPAGSSGQTLQSAPTSFTFVVVPEPASTGLLLGGAALLAGSRRRRLG